MKLGSERFLITCASGKGNRKAPVQVFLQQKAHDIAQRMLQRGMRDVRIEVQRVTLDGSGNECWEQVEVLEAKAQQAQPRVVMTIAVMPNGQPVIACPGIHRKVECITLLADVMKIVAGYQPPNAATLAQQTQQAADNGQQLLAG